VSAAEGSASEAFWDEAAPGWARQQELLRAYTAPVSEWLIAAIDAQPGQRVLELAAGIGDTGFMVAPRLLPGGELISTDRSEAMLAAARERASELGLENVEHRRMGAEWIDLPVASIDAVLCRWGLMLIPDPPAALREMRRVLRPGGRLALAVWDAIEHNPWASIPAAVLRERGLAGAPEPGAPGPFALGDRERLQGLLEGAGFQEVELDAVDLLERHATFESFWEARLDLSRVFHDAALSQPAEQIEELRAALAARLADHTDPDGSIALPGRTLVAAASA
jgi:SAM-dependent methyltransferase